MLRSLGVRFAAFTLYAPALRTEEARILTAAFAGLEAPRWRPPVDRPSRPPEPLPSPRALAAYGLQAIGTVLVPVEALERLDAHLRATPTHAGAVTLTPEALADLGWDEATARTIMRALDFAPARKTAPGEASLWRLRREKPSPARPTAATVVPSPSPFAALAALQAPPPRKRRPRKPRRAASRPA